MVLLTYAINKQTNKQKENPQTLAKGHVFHSFVRKVNIPLLSACRNNLKKKSTKSVLLKKKTKLLYEYPNQNILCIKPSIVCYAFLFFRPYRISVAHHLCFLAQFTPRGLTGKKKKKMWPVTQNAQRDQST